MMIGGRGHVATYYVRSRTYRVTCNACLRIVRRGYKAVYFDINAMNPSYFAVKLQRFGFTWPADSYDVANVICNIYNQLFTCK